MGRFLIDRNAEILEAAGATSVQKVYIDRITGNCSHRHGTTRMGNDPEISVLDRWCRSHEVDNLFVVDGGPSPTGTGINPTLTIMANAGRVAEHIANGPTRRGSRSGHRSRFALTISELNDHGINRLGEPLVEEQLAYQAVLLVEPVRHPERDHRRRVKERQSAVMGGGRKRAQDRRCHSWRSSCSQAEEHAMGEVGMLRDPRRSVAPIPSPAS